MDIGEKMIEVHKSISNEDAELDEEILQLLKKLEEVKVQYHQLFNQPINKDLKILKLKIKILKLEIKQLKIR